MNTDLSSSQKDPQHQQLESSYGSDWLVSTAYLTWSWSGTRGYTRTRNTPAHAQKAAFSDDHQLNHQHTALI